MKDLLDGKSISETPKKNSISGKIDLLSNIDQDYEHHPDYVGNDPEMAE